MSDRIPKRGKALKSCQICFLQYIFSICRTAQAGSDPPFHCCLAGSKQSFELIHPHHLPSEVLKTGFH
jgi:hypothetical protein